MKLYLRLYIKDIDKYFIHNITFFFKFHVSVSFSPLFGMLP